MEVETLLHLAQRLNYLKSEQLTSALGILTEISKMLTVMRKKILTPDTSAPCT